MAKSYNTEPYYDDFDASKGYHRILFRPGYAVQARELTQIQTLLQNQITKFGDHMFKEGAMVIPGEASIDTQIDYVKLESTYGGVLTDTIVANFLGKTITSTSNGLTAEVIWYSKSTGSDAPALFVRYKTAADDNTTKTFTGSDVIEDVDGAWSAQVLALNPTGKGSIASIKEGIYYIKGCFVYVPAETIVLDKFTNTPSYRIGLRVSESETTAEEDESLFDNAQNSFNYAAPGAHRYTITTDFVALAVDSEEDSNFIELIRTGDGQVKKQVKQTEYSVIAREFARRTYDESGNYTVRNFEIDVREYRDNNRGDWTAGRVYLSGDVVTNSGHYYVARNSGQASSSVPPTHTSGAVYDGPSAGSGVQWEYTDTPYYNRGIYSPDPLATLSENNAMEAKLAVGLEPGKAYVQGYEIEKVGTEYVAVEKARTTVQVNAEVIPATVGNYLKIANVYGVPPTSFEAVTLYDRKISTNGSVPASGTAIGTARVRFVELDTGTYGSAAAVYKLGLFDIQLNSSYDFNLDVKSVYYNNASGADFTADIDPILTQLTGSVSGSSTTLTGIGTTFQTQLSVGDYISVTNTSGTVETRRINAVGGQTTATIDAAFSGTVTNSAFKLVTTKIYEPENVSLLFPLGQTTVDHVLSSDSINDTVYSVYEIKTGSISSGTVTVSTASGNMANGADNDQYIIFDKTTGNVLSWSVNSIVGSGATLNVTSGSGWANGDDVVVVCQVNKSGDTLTRKLKTLNSAATASFTTQATAQARSISLGKADGYRLISVKMKTGTFASPGSTYSLDVTDRYDFDNGHRATHYDTAKIVLKGSYAPPEAPIQVTFDYFSHGTGDYFTRDSYPTNVDYKAIPIYNGVSLGDVLDFRPRIDDAGTSFTGTNASLTLIPKRGVDPYADYSYYLGRKVKIAVDFAGNFFALDGVPSLNPGEPLDPSLGLVLYGLTLSPYTHTTSTNSVTVQKYDNKRYTMRDIGKLEKRIDNLEYYASLSLLEQQTESLNIVDSSGLDRFKNGFIVDGFNGHDTGDTNSLDYVCSVDMENAQLRPFFSMNNVNLLEKATNNTERGLANYQTYGDVITLPVVDHIPFIKQEFCSKLENINPFAVFTFLGDVKINPSSDDWFEVDRRPDLVLNVEGNFNTIKALAEKKGVLGTIWNSWQTQWTGAPVSRGTNQYSGRYAQAWGANLKAGIQLSPDEMNARFGVKAGQGWARREITMETTATSIGQTRSGIKTSLVAKIDRQVVGDRVLSTAAIPYMRSRNILVQIKKLKPNTKFYPFFDGVNIADYCTPASKMTYTPVSGTFDIETNVGGLSAGTARQIGGDSQVCLNRGDVITGGTSGATAVVVGKEYNPDTLTYSLYIVNIKGTFSATETVTGSVSAATGTVGSVTTGSLGGNLITNYAGEINLLFNIPNNDALRFRCGTRELKLVDVNSADGVFTSRARANYRAEGILETRQQTVHSVRNAELVEEQLRDNRVIVNTAERVVADTGWYDPLAQTFLVEQKGGCFLSKVDVFFATKDDKIPVTLEIRECVNGYPGKRVLPFSRVTISPSQVNISTSTVPLADGTVVNSYNTATTFTFPSPVYVQENTEYALVLSSDSNAYRVWVSEIGDLMPGTARTISEQPYLGSLFKSQNASTWSAVQTQDLKFRIYRAQFDTSVIANIEYVNDQLPLQTLDTDPFETRNGTNKVRVWQKDHGIPAPVDTNTFVTISTTNDTGTGTITTTTSSTAVTGVSTAFSTQLSVGTCLYKTDGTFIGKVSAIGSNTGITLAANAAVAVSGAAFAYKLPLNGIPANEIFKQHTFSSTGLDLDSYVITTTTSATSSGYVGGTTVRSTRHLQFDAVQPSVTMQSFSETPVEFGIKTISGKSVHSSTQTPYVEDAGYTGVLVNENNYFSSPRMIASTENENTPNTNSLKSLYFNVQMSTTNNALSPIIDTHRTSMVVINNKVNSATETNTNVSDLDYNVILSAATGVTISSNSITTSTQQAAFKLANVGKYLTIAGASSGSSTRLITAVAADGTSITFDSAPSAVTGNVTLTQRERFVGENAPIESGTHSKYVTKKITFADPSTYIKVNFAVNLPAEAAVEVWYRTNPVGSTADFDSLSYTRITNPDASIVNSQNETNQFFDASFSATAAAFDAIQVKLVMKSTNSSQVPLIKDLRVVCCA